MKCTICDKENQWLSIIGTDTACAKCLAKETIFKEMRFSDEKRLNKILRKRKFENFSQLKQVTEEDYEQIIAEKDNPELKKFKEKKVNVDDDMEIPLE